MNTIVHPFGTGSDFPGDAQALGREQRAFEAHADVPLTLTATLDGTLDSERLQRALAHVAARHPATRLAFGRVDGLRGLRQHFEGPAPVMTLSAPAARGDVPALQASVQRLREPGGPERTYVSLAANPLAIDGPSLVTLMRELAQAYADDAVPAGEAPLSYADYLEWTAGLAQDNVEAGQAYWQAVRDRLAGFDAPRLPWRQAGTAPIGALRTLSAPLPEADAAALAGLASQLDLPLVHVLQAAWWLLLARLDPTGRFCAGWWQDSRDDFEALAGAVGRYESVLPVTVEPDAERSVADWLGQFSAQLQQHAGWREHATADAASGTPTRIGFATTGPALLRAHHGDIAWRIAAPQAPTPGVELALHVNAGDAGLPGELALHYSAEHYRADAMACLLDQYLTLLRTLPTQSGTTVSALPLATAADQARIAAMHGPTLHVGTQMLPQRLAHWAAERPLAAALSTGGRQWSYAELSAAVDALASHLPSLGWRPGQPVGLLLPRSGELVIALLAVMRAGGAYLPLDPAWPPQRRARILADAGATLVLTDAAHLADAAGPTPHTDVAAWPASSSGVTSGASLPDIEADQTAYVLYTSGSTGTPKGVPISHAQLLNYAAASGQALRLDRCERFALTSTVAADLGNTTLFGALWHGGCLCVADDADMQDAASFARFLAREQVDCLKIVPSHLDALLDGDAAPLALPPHATVVVGGEAASPALLARLRKRAPDVRLCNHYGPTETTVGILVHEAGRAADLPEAPLPLTRVLANCEAHVRTVAGQPATVGETGELYLGGAQLGAGYLGGVASDAFVPHPEHPGRRLYRSGDLARYLPEGGIELNGRADSQIKIRGFRIECGEIEQALAALPGVRQAVVLPVTADDGTTRLATWLVPEAEADGALTAARRNALRQALAERLPDPMIPAQWFAVAVLPRLRNGKIDRRALAASALAEPAGASGPSREPDSALEALLLDQLRDLLGAPTLAVHDDLFEAGGHSLLVIKLVARIRKLLKLEIAPAVVFDAPSAAALASALRATATDPDGLETLAGLQRQLAAMSPEALAALRASAGATA